MTEIENQDYYLEQLHDQVSFLIDACHSYDKGNFKQAKMISNIVRTIVKDAGENTVSVLEHLKRKEKMKFYNTGFEAKNVKININLVGIVTVPTKVPTVIKQFDNIYLPLLDKSNQVDVKWLDFDDWWKSQIVVYKSESINGTYTRKKLMLTMAEQDGGTHVDSHLKMDKKYKELAYAANYFHHVDLYGNQSPIVNMHFAIVRQIAHELVISLIKEFELLVDYKPTNSINLRGVPEHSIKQPGLMIAEGSSFDSTRTTHPHKAPSGVAQTPPPGAKYVKFHF